MAVVLLLVGVSRALAQVTVGENVSLDLNALLQAGYTADYGNFVNSDHGFTFGGNANLAGSYYSPSFLSFTVSPYYNQSRAEFHLPIDFRQQRGKRQREHLLRQQLSGFHQLQQELQQLGDLRVAGVSELHHSWKWRRFEHRLGS